MLTGKSAFIVGGTNGIGRCCAETFIKYGAEVVIVGIEADEEIQKMASEIGLKCWGLHADVTKFDAMEKAVNFAVEKMGKVDIAVNSAGDGGFGNIFDMDHEAFAKVIEVCLYGTFHAMRFETAQMIKQGKGGAIVNISSINSTVPYYQIGAYAAAKAGVDMLGKVAAMEVGKYGIRINSICPGFTNTSLIDMFVSSKEITSEVMTRTPLKRYGEPIDIAEAVAFLVSDKASFITGTKLAVDGGIENMGYPEVLKTLMGEDTWRQLYK